ncbi:MAG: thioredoxin [Elusimicrobia bacterium]|nr:thioredoxin [Elusimicrobiota bacterium]MBU2614591.1 thioredoxin [Elusimicrobiota bacterium]
MSEVILNEQNFKPEVLDAKGIVLVDFWAEWCGPCKMMFPVIEELAKEYAGKAKICKLNVDENQEIASRHSVMAIPTIIIFKDGKPMERVVGAQQKKALVERINSLL